MNHHRLCVRQAHLFAAILLSLLPALAHTAPIDIDVRDHGAKPDAQTLNTLPIQKAIDAAAAAGGGG